MICPYPIVARTFFQKFNKYHKVEGDGKGFEGILRGLWAKGRSH